MSTRRLAAVAVSALAGTMAAGIAVAPGAQAAAVTPHASAATPAAVPVSVGKVYALASGSVLYALDGSTIKLPSIGASDVTFSPDGSRIAYVDEKGALISVRSDGSDKIVLDSNPHHSHPTFAEGGAVVVSDVGEALASVPATGGPMTRINAGGYSTWSPSGGSGSFIVRVRASTVGGTVVERVDLHTGAVLPLTPPAPSGTTYDNLALSPDGRTVAYTAQVRVGDPEMGSGFYGKDIFTVPTDGSGVSNAPTRYTNGLIANPPQDQATYLNADSAAWSPDGSKIGFKITPNGNVYTNAYNNPFYVPANAPGSAPVSFGIFPVPTAPQYSPPGPPVWQPIGHDLVQRLDGKDRIGTAVQTSTWGWATYGQPAGGRKAANIAVLTRSDLPADALSGSALAAHAGGPLLLTASAGLDPATRAELKRTLAPGSSVYLLGGTAALSPAVEQGIRDAGFAPVRLYGGDRFETSVSVANQIGKISGDTAPTVLLATGANYPDALAAGSAAGSTPGGVVLLTSDNTMPSATETWLGTHHAVATFAVGHQADNAAKSAHVGETPLAGADRYATAATVARRFFPGPHTAGIATGLNWADALSGGALMGSYGGPLLLTPTADLDPSTASYLRDGSSGLSSLFVFGGLAAVGNSPAHQAGDLIGIPGAERFAENDPTQR